MKDKAHSPASYLPVASKTASKHSCEGPKVALPHSIPQCLFCASDLLPSTSSTEETCQKHMYHKPAILSFGISLVPIERVFSAGFLKESQISSTHYFYEDPYLQMRTQISISKRPLFHIEFLLFSSIDLNHPDNQSNINSPWEALLLEVKSPTGSRQN